MGRKFYVFVILMLGIYSCDRKPADINNEIEFVSQIAQDSINQMDQTAMDEVNFETEKQESSFSFWKLISIISIAINLLLFYFIRWQIRNEKKNKRAFETQLAGAKNVNSHERYEPTPSTKIRNEAEPEPSDSRFLEPSAPSKIERNLGEEDEKIEVKLSLKGTGNQTFEEIEKNEPKVLFAEKAKDTGVFSSVSEHRDPYKSYFKLFVDLSNQNEAEFEVLDSEFILKQGSNDPDIYLYNACDPENSNQNFISEIVTIEKGVAQLVNGNWQIKQGNKAKIKFR